MNQELDPKCPLPPVESVGYIEQLLSEEYFTELNDEHFQPCDVDSDQFNLLID